MEPIAISPGHDDGGAADLASLLRLSAMKTLDLQQTKVPRCNLGQILSFS